MLSRPEEIEVIYLVAIGCQRISGPFLWGNANILISADGIGDYRVLDLGAGFDLVCSSTAIAQGSAAVPRNPFDNFLDDLMNTQ